jgi:hypothetical protein
MSRDRGEQALYERLTAHAFEVCPTSICGVRAADRNGAMTKAEQAGA